MKFLEEGGPQFWIGNDPNAPVTVGAENGAVTPNDLGYYTEFMGQEQTDQPVFMPVMRLENTITSAAVSEATRAPRHKVDGYNPWEEIKGTDYEQHWDRFVGVFNPEHALAVKRDIYREEYDKQLLSSAPIAQRFAYGLVAGLVDPLLLIPGGAFVRGAKGGFSAFKSALSVGGATTAMVAAQEAMLHTTQQTRTTEESLVNIGASTLIGGLLGGAGAKLLSDVELFRLLTKVEQEITQGSPRPQTFDMDAILDWNYRNPPIVLDDTLGSVAEARNIKTRQLFKHSVDTFVRRYEDSIAGLEPDGVKELEMLAQKMSPLERNIWAESEPFSMQSASLSAAARESETLEALAIAGKTETVARITRWLNPNLRTAMSAVPEVREAGMKLSERSYYIEGNAAGQATPQAAETFARMWRGGLILAIDENDVLYRSYRQRGGQMTRTDFQEATGRVLMTGEASPDAEVNSAASSWKKNQADPGTREARTAGVIPEGQDVFQTYYGRIFNRLKLGRDEFGFKNAMRLWVKDSIPEWRSNAVIAEIKKLDKALKGKSPKEQKQLKNEARQRIESVFDDADSLANDIAETAFNRAMGRGGTVEQFNQIKVGDLQLTISPPNKMLLPWLETNARSIGDRMALTLGGDVELTRMFGTLDMRETFDKIHKAYDKLREQAKDKPKLLERLQKAERDDINDLEGMRDILRGTYRESIQDDNFARISRIATKFNYVRMMGMVVLASIPEVVRTAAVHGMTPFMETMGQAISSPKAFKASQRELRMMGLVGDRIMAHRIATMADIFNSYHNRGPVERMLDNMVEVANHWNGLRLWTDYMKTIAGVTTQNRVLRIADNWAAASDRDKRYMNYLGLDEGKAERIKELFARHGEDVDGVLVANTEKWVQEGSESAVRDAVTMRMYRAAVAKDVDTIVVHRSIGDIPLFANTPLGRLIFQFNTFNIASHQRILLRGLQEGPTRFLSSLAAMTSMGMLQTYIRSILNNRDVPEFAENPGWWIGEGLDYSGVLMIPMQMGNMAERAVGFNPIKSALKFADEGDARSMKMRDVNFSHIFGPSVGTVEDMLRVAQIPGRLAMGEDITKGQKGAAERLLLFNSYLGERSFLRYIVNPPEE